MQRVFQTGMDACDALGVQTAWFFLAIGFLVGPLALLFSAVQDPTILTSLKRSQSAAFALIWRNIADPLDKRYAKYKEPFMKPISGVVLDLGSGLGQNLKYLDPSKITRLLLVEPNPGMHAGLRKNALGAGFKEGQFEIVACGAEEKAKVEQLTGLGNESVDSVVSLLALCGIPESRKVIAALYDYLKPGGTFYFFEHVASQHPGSRRTQDRLNPLWMFLFGGCNLNRATNKWILESFEWGETKEMKVDFENEKALDPKSYGWARKPFRQ